MKKVYQKFAASLSRFLLNKFAQSFSSNCYQSIDTLPIFYWNKIHETGNLSYLGRSKNVHISKKKPGIFRDRALKIVWRRIMDEFIARFGFSENFLDIHRKEKEIAKLIVQQIENKDKSLNAFIKIAEEELLELKKANKGGDFGMTKSAIEQGMGFSINPMIYTVSEFYSDVKLLEKQSKASNQK